MSHQRNARGWLATAAAGAMLASGLALPQHAFGELQYDRIPQGQMTAVATDSEEKTGEGANGAIGLVLDGKTDTYWHTAWSGGKAPLPHWFVVQLGKDPVQLGRVELTPRQSSTGSSRVGEYDLFAVSAPECTPAAFEGKSPVKSGSFDGAVSTAAETRQITLDKPVEANCVKVVYKSSWGGMPNSGSESLPEEVASLAEFNAFTASGTPDAEEPAEEPGGIAVDVPEGAHSITDGVLTVRTHPDFPQVVDYRIGDAQLPGRLGQALTAVSINGTARAVNVGDVATTDSSVTYPLTFADLPGVSMNAVLTVKDQVLTWTLTDIVDPKQQVDRIAVPQLDLVSVRGSDKASTVFAAKMSVNRAASGDRFLPVATSAETSGNAWAAVANNSALAAGFETNAIGDNTAKDGVSNANRYAYRIATLDGNKFGAVSPAEWTYRSGAVKTYDDGSGIGVDDDPMIQVKVTADANNDTKVDWQDGAVAARDILAPIIGQDDVANRVVSRIPFNIVSQATHPFLRTLDDTKRIALETDNLGQQVLLKGYQAEGHDSAQGDYAGHFNERAGGLKDLKTLTEQGKDWNATFGIHVNATETYSEAHAFSEALLFMPPRKAWGWMNQSYYMNNPKDLATGNVFKRMKELRKVFPADSNLNWLYWDVYYPRGWEGDRFAQGFMKDGWRISSEWSDALPRFNTWSHWANDENYGGQKNKGIESKLIRFIQNSYRDTWNPDPMLGNANVVEFEGWTGNVDHTPFIRNIWERNLPAKFLQRSDIMTWDKGRMTFANGTQVTSDVESIDGKTLPNDRTITYDGSTVFDQGRYLLPWSNGGKDRLYYWNPDGASHEWTLTKAWQSQSTLTLFKLTDTGREKVADVAVSGGKVTLPKTEAGTAYVLYPTSAVPEAKAPQWGEGSHIEDPGFFSGTLDAYEVKGDATVVETARQNKQAQLGAGTSSISQEVTLPAGTYSMWAWIEIEPGKTRTVEVRAEGDGVKPMHLQPVKDGAVVTTITDSGAINATASDEKLRTHFQRVPVRITTDGTPFTFTVAALDGDAKVAVDDLRAVAQKAPVDKAPTDETVVFEDFEDVDTGYWPFVTGSTNAGGDARTQLAERHEPYSQSGWYGLTTGSAKEASEGGKYIDNVLDGTWSLLAHQENAGMVLRTTSASVPLKRGHRYRVTMDYQAAYDGDYDMVLGTDVAGKGSWSESVAQRWPLAMARGAGWKDSSGKAGSGTTQFVKEFTVTKTPMFLGVIKRGGNIQGDLTIDNFRVEDLGTKPMVSIDAKPVASEKDGHHQLDVTTTVEVAEGEATDVAHALTGPEGWIITPKDKGATTIDADTTSVQHWTVQVPRDGKADALLFTGSWTVDGAKGEGTATTPVDPANFPLLYPIGGDDLTVTDVDSEETTGEPAPNGPAAAAIDGDPATYWHTQWSTAQPGFPHHISLAVKGARTCTLEGFEYTARNAANGRAKGYELYVSTDGKEWGDPVATGSFSTATGPQVVHFDKPVRGTHVKLVETSSQAGNAFGGAAELRVGGQCTFPEPVKAHSAGAKLVGHDTFVWGNAKGSEGLTAVSEGRVGDEWVGDGEATVDDNGQYAIKLGDNAAKAGTHQVRVRVGELTSNTVTLTRVARANYKIAPQTVVGRTANAWGTLQSDATVITQVFVPGKGWSDSQRVRAKAGTMYTVELTYGKHTAGTQRWRVVVDHAHGEREVLAPKTQQRLATPTAKSAGQAPAGRLANVWGHSYGKTPAKAWTEVKVNGTWSRSQVRTLDGKGNYVIPLTYGRNNPGTYTWRVAVEYPGLGVVRSDAFTFTRR